MQQLDLKVISQLCQWLAQAESVWLCTVIHTWGSAPRCPGSLLACNASGAVVGSLSGGCIEDDLLEQLNTGQLAVDTCCYKLYGETQHDIERFKMPCGGTLGILIEPITVAQRDDFVLIEQALLQQKNILRLHNWQMNTKNIQTTENPPSIEFEKDDSRKPVLLKQVYGPATHLFIIGINETSQILAQFALATGYRVSICDPRSEKTSQWPVINTAVLTMMPDDAVRQFANDANTAIVAVSHDPRVDDMGLMDAFSTPAFYIGAMGSIKTSDKRRQRLRLLGISDKQIARLHAPIGLDIRSKTPAEIAIAILAEIIAVRANKKSL